VTDAERRPVTSTRDRRGRQCRQQPRRRSPFSFGFGMSGTPSGLGNALLALPVALVLSEAITRLLDCREQEQAAVASEQAVEQAAAAAQQAPAPGRPGQRGTAAAASPVGATVAWTSESRPGVTGSSTVTGLEQAADGSECMTVTDIVIVDGEETRAPKRMCRRPPSQRFVRV
jgi:surface antigen